MSWPTLEGQTFGKYLLLEPLGRGGMAQVYRAYHAQLNRYVALKVLRPELARDQGYQQRFQHEARIIANLRHKNIVQVHDFDAQGDIAYIVMELLEGSSLREKLIGYRTQNTRIPLSELFRITSDALEGLRYAHDQGLIHRDIKPANIMLTTSGEAVLTDFGIAQIMSGEHSSTTNAIMGTVSYMAPEQGLNGHYDKRSDIYSLGIVFYEMLTGHIPFDADTPLAVLMKHMTDPLPPLRLIDPTIPQAIEQVVIKALAKDPANRYQTCAEMQADLAICAGEMQDEQPRPGISPEETFGVMKVFSGSDRQQITDLQMATSETDPDLHTVTRKPGEFFPGGRKIGPVEKFFSKRLQVTPAVLAGLTIVVLFNFFNSMASSLTGAQLYQRNWPLEIILLAGFLALIMWAVETTWFLIPVIILLGNGLLLAYTSLSGRWMDWGFLWLLELIIIGAGVYIPIHLRQAGEKRKFLAHINGAVFYVITLVCASIIYVLSLAPALFSRGH